MKIAFIATLIGSAAAFTTTHPVYHGSTTLSRTILNAAELTPEPEGGEELSKVSSSSLPDSRMKNLGAAEENNADGDVYTFWLSAVASGSEVKKLRMQTEKEASKKANFPGFRKVSWSTLLKWHSLQNSSFAGVFVIAMFDNFLWRPPLSQR